MFWKSAINPLVLFITLLLSCGPSRLPDEGNKDVNGNTPRQRPSNENRNEHEVATALRKALALKGTKWPYSAEYALALPAGPRLAGHPARRRFVARNRKSFYAEITAEAWSSQLLLRSKDFFWEYQNKDERSRLFKAQVWIDQETPESWLHQRGFTFNSYTDLDEDLLSVFGKVLARSKVLRRIRRGSETRLTLSTEAWGELVVTLAPGRVEVKGQTPAGEKTLFHYVYGAGPPNWKPDPQAELLSRFTRARQADVRVLEAGFTMDSILNTTFAGLPQVLSISLLKAQEHARRHGFLFPQAGQATILHAETYGGQLSLHIKAGGKAYWISQFPRAGSFPILETFIKRRRKFKDYDVLEIVDVGTKCRLVYYEAKNRRLITSILREGSPDEPVGFQDANLDRLVASLRPVE
jgi:hypothetical protein